MIAIADTIVALIAGLAIYPIVFASSLEPTAGLGLLFQSLSVAFGNMPFGDLFGTLFFIMIVFAAFTSSIAMLEPTAAYLAERQGLSRFTAGCVAGLCIWLVSLLTIFSFSGEEWTKISFGMGSNLFEFLDYLTANILLPLGGLFISLFVGWTMNKRIVNEELSLTELQFTIVIHLLRWVAPIAILCVFANSIGLLAF